MIGKTAWLGLVIGLGMAAPLTAQTGLQVPAGTPRFNVGGALVVGQPVGEFQNYIDVGFGLIANGRYNLDAAGVVSLRADLSFLNYGNETKQVCLGGGAGCRITLDLTTSNNIVGGNFGLHFMAPSGPIRPYAHGGIGFSYFATESRVKGTNNSEDFANTTNFDDGTFAWIAGGGFHIPVSHGRTPISIDIGARYDRNGRVAYLTEGGITDNPDGTINLDPIRSDANLVKYYIGVNVGIPGGR
jgi:opacity protein-like surface antigen